MGNVRSGDVSVVDTGSLTVTTTVKIGGMPYGVATSEDGSLVLVTNQQAGTVAVLDSGSLGLKATIPVGRYPEGIAVDGAFAYVANWFSGFGLGHRPEIVEGNRPHPRGGGPPQPRRRLEPGRRCDETGHTRDPVPPPRPGGLRQG